MVKLKSVMKEIQSIILAAGKGTRMKSDLAKVLHPVCGLPMLQYVIDAVQSAGSLKNYIVLGHQYDEVNKIVSANCTAVRQKELKGTADAVRSVKKYFQGYSGDVIVLCGDTPLLRVETLKTLIKRHHESGAACTVLTAVLGNSRGYGRIIRGIHGDPVAIREEKDASPDERKILEINVGVYCFKAAALFQALAQVKENSLKKEFYLTDVVAVMAEKRWKIDALEIDDPQEGLGVNSRMDLAVAQRVIRLRILERFMINGVTIIDPDSTFIDAGVKIGVDTVIKPFTVIEADVVIGKKCVIGPFAHLRPQTRIADHTEIGNFAEVSRSKIGTHCFMKHFSFLGDAVVGNGVNIGAGVVTANFDGKEKHGTKIGDGSFVGSDSILVAPVRIGKNAVTGAGCVVAKEKIIPDGHVMVGVPGRIIGKKKT